MILHKNGFGRLYSFSILRPHVRNSSYLNKPDVKSSFGKIGFPVSSVAFLMLKQANMLDIASQTVTSAKCLVLVFSDWSLENTCTAYLPGQILVCWVKPFISEPNGLYC